MFRGLLKSTRPQSKDIIWAVVNSYSILVPGTDSNLASPVCGLIGSNKLKNECMEEDACMHSQRRLSLAWCFLGLLLSLSAIAN